MGVPPKIGRLTIYVGELTGMFELRMQIQMYWSKFVNKIIIALSKLSAHANFQNALLP